MGLYASGEDYLEAILMIGKKQGVIRSVDIARHMGVSKPSVCHAVTILRKSGFLTMDEERYIHLTKKGQEIAEKIYERHCFFREQLMAAGIDKATAEKDACRLEHAISEESFKKLKESMKISKRTV
ncbi:MAG: metal-dependent transcriptional regulator [Ruminococcus sp.]|jgi:Mn-dependent DtxR family transcriptional regulator